MHQKAPFPHRSFQFSTIIFLPIPHPSGREKSSPYSTPPWALLQNPESPTARRWSVGFNLRTHVVAFALLNFLWLSILCLNYSTWHSDVVMTPTSPFTLDLISSRIQMSALGHTLTPLCSVCRQFFGFIPGDVHVLQISSDHVHPIFFVDIPAFTCSPSAPL